MNELTIFAKKRTTHEGKPFHTYLTRLTRLDGTQVTVQVKFRQSCNPPKPEQCPMNIIAGLNDMSLASKTITDEYTGEIIESRTLWISAYERGTEYVDKSLDGYII